MLTTIAPPDGRGCGDRSEEAPYACCGFGEDGSPVEFFIVDPAIPWPGEFQRGVKILPRNPKDPDSVNDLIVFVGKKFYQSPWDFVEETRRFGASRKLPHNLPFDLLTPGDSRMVLVHSKAIPTFDYESNLDKPYYGCQCFKSLYDPKRWAKACPGWHTDPVKPCTHALKDLAFLVHDDLEPAIPFNELYQVNMPSFSYLSTYPKKPISYRETTWQVGIFMALPLTHIEYCQRPDEKSKANAEAAGFQTMVMEH